jgi:hypothetical protein
MKQRNRNCPVRPEEFPLGSVNSRAAARELLESRKKLSEEGFVLVNDLLQNCSPSEPSMEIED